MYRVSLALMFGFVGSLTVLEHPVYGQLRIVSYNLPMQNFAGGGPRPGTDVVLQAIGNQMFNGIAKPIDVLLYQEADSMATSGQALVDLLNGVYGAGTYARSFLEGLTTGGGRPGLIYNTNSVELLSEIQLGNVGSGNNQQPRATLRYQLRPLGYDSSADIFAYNSHYKADTGSVNQNRRLVEAEAIRDNARFLGSDRHIIYAGDFNIRNSNEPMYQHLLSSGNGQAFDPIDTPGNWHNNSAFKHVHTQSPLSTADVPPGSGLVGGGVDDRFDFQLVTERLLDGEGLNYIPNSYRVFGNNGTHTLSDSINTGTGASRLVLEAMMTASDHMPVVADYQVPAMMFADVTAFPSTVGLGANVDFDVFVENIANVVVAHGADALHYEISVSGALSGGASGSLMALAGSNSYPISLDTSTVGEQSGMVSVITTSQSAANPVYNFPIQFTVEANFMEADFNQDGVVDGLDLAVWENQFAVGPGADANGDGESDGSDFLIWQRQFGETSPLTATATVVPEPTTASIVLAMSACLSLSRRREKYSAL